MSELTPELIVLTYVLAQIESAASCFLNDPARDSLAALMVGRYPALERALKLTLEECERAILWAETDAGSTHDTP